MAKAKVVEIGKQRAATRLGPGLHPARIEGAAEGGFTVRLRSGELVAAVLSEEIELAFAEECLRDRRSVLVAEEGGSVVIFGALQTTRAIERDAGDRARVAARRLELLAEEGVKIQVGKATLEMDRNGAVRLSGDRLTLDAATVVRVLAALAELP